MKLRGGVSLARSKAKFDSTPFVEIVKVAERNGQLNELILFLTQHPNVHLRLELRIATRLIEDLKAHTPDRKINEEHKNLLYQFSEERLGSARHYEWLLNRTDRSRKDQENLADYVGKYMQIFGSSDKDKKFSKTELEIIQQNKRFSYKNTVTFKNGDDFPYTGYVFYTEKILYFSGLNENYARPFMCFVKPPEQILSESILRGGMLGLHDPNLNIYFREFVLIPEGNKLFNRFKQAVTEKEVQHIFREDLFAKELDPDAPIKV
jgi:hypothetical protein